MRRHGQQQVIGPPLPVREDHLLALHGRGLVIGEEANAVLGQARIDHAAPAFAQDGQRERQRAKDFQGHRHPARGEEAFDQQGHLEGRRRALVRRAKNADAQPPAREGPQRLGRARDGLRVVDVMAILWQARHGLGRQLGPQRHDQRVGLIAPAVHLGCAGGRVQMGERALHNADTMTLQRAQRPLPGLQRRLAHQAPRLAEAHHEVSAPVDDDHVVRGVQLIAQPPGRRQPAKTTPENENASHG